MRRKKKARKKKSTRRGRARAQPKPPKPVATTRSPEASGPPCLQPQSAHEWNAELDRINQRLGRRPWDDLWAEFMSSDANRRWWDHVAVAGSVYTIRPEVIRALAEASKRGPAAFDPDDMACNLRFFETCQKNAADTVGVAGGVAIRSPLAREPVRLVELLRRHRDIPWADRFVRQVAAGHPRLAAEIDRAVSSARSDVRDAAGALICSHDFLAERDGLRMLARKLDLGIAFPLRRANTGFNVEDADGRAPLEVGKAKEEFIERKTAFFRRWWLSELTTWDLPVPLGTLVDMPLGLLVRIFGHDAVVPNAIPDHFAVRQQDEHDSVGRISISDSPLRRPDRASPGNASLHGHAYESWRQEIAVRQRFDGKLPYGGAEKLVAGLSKVLGVEGARVRRIRTLYLKQFR